MMAVKMRCEARKAADSVLDISRYTEMDIEKGHDTAGVIGASHGVHADYKHLDLWNETKQSYEGAKQKALDHTQQHWHNFLSLQYLILKQKQSFNYFKSFIICARGSSVIDKMTFFKLLL